MSAQVLPAKLYGGAQSERAYALVEAPDAGYCLAGWTRSFGPGTPNASNVLVTKTDAAGVPVWSRMSIGMNDDEAYSMVRTSDHGYALTGWTRSYGTGIPNKNIFAIKLDNAGNQVWAWVYGGSQDDEAYSIIETQDGGFAITGWTSSFGPQPTPNLFVLKLAPQGWPQWFCAYWAGPMHVEDEGHSIVQTPDQGFAVVGRMKATSPNQYDPFLLKLDPSGNVQWARVVPGQLDEDDAWSVAVDNMGRVLVAGWTRSFGTNPGVTADVFAAQFALDGSLLWSRTYGWPAGDEQVLDDRSLTATADGGCALSGLTTSVGPGIPNPNFLLLKLDANGVPMWCRSHPSPYWPGLQNDVALPMVEQAAGGYAVAGYSNSWNLLGGGDDMMLSTFDALGNRPVCTERQGAPVDSAPWLEWPMTGAACYVTEDTMRLVPVTVRHDSVCYDTASMGAKEMTTDQVRMTNRDGLGMKVLRGKVELTLARTGRVAVHVFAADGRRAATLADREFGEGRHELALPLSLPAGTYLVRAETERTAVSAKAVRF
jgi:hypothetical protein